MNEKKLNYERQKARREMRDEIREAQMIKQNAEVAHIAIFLGACILGQGSGDPAAVENAAVYWELAQNQAQQMSLNESEKEERNDD